MATKDIVKETNPAVSATPDSAPAPKRDIALRLGTTVTVQVADGMDLVNNETGELFKPGVATLITVTVSALRRLQDGDLQLV